jgi:hypothetical protein
MAGVTAKLRGPGKGAKLRDTRTAVKALVGAGCSVEDIEIEVTPKSALVRVKREPKAAVPDADGIVARLR